MKKQELYKFAKSLNIKSNILDEFLCKVLIISKKELFLIDEIDDTSTKYIKKILKKLQNGVPIEYITKTSNFYSIDFYVDERVLIPRNETEILVEQAIKEAKKYDNITLIDVGTGSSNIAISCCLNLDNVEKCYVTDISTKALQVSKINIKKYDLEDKIIQLKGNLLTPILNSFPLVKPSLLSLPKGETGKGKTFGKDEATLKNINKFSSPSTRISSSYVILGQPERLNRESTRGSGEKGLEDESIIITANLPYIKNGDFKNMSFKTLKYEPKMALFGGKNTGFELYEKLINEIIKLKIYKSRNLINHKQSDFKVIILFIEIGFDQYEYSKKYLENLGLKYEYFKDNTGIYRCIKINF